MAPVVTAMEACSGSRPVAKALMASSSITWILGTGMPCEMQRFSTMRRMETIDGEVTTRIEQLPSALLGAAETFAGIDASRRLSMAWVA